MKKWFSHRNLNDLEYQQRAVDQCIDSMNDNEITVLASSPSSGKTLMSIYLIDRYLKHNPTHKVLVLTHGTTVLRTQFYEDIVKYKPSFTYNCVNGKPYNDDVQVNVSLPQSIYRKNLNEFDLIVVDEAHQYYLKNMVQTIIKKGNPSKQLLLTGTPSVFVKLNYNIIIVPLSDVIDQGMSSDLYINIIPSSYHFNIKKDYNSSNELKSTVYFSKKETNETLNNLLVDIVNNTNNINKTSISYDWSEILNYVNKSMFVCKSQKQAIQLKKYFDSFDIDSALSVVDVDIDSTEIKRFKEDSDCLVLIVVGRGILGFNLPELVNVVDLTLSHNIDRIYQLMARVIRKHPNGARKMFFKVSLNDYVDYFKFVMTAVLSLSKDEFISKWNGTNFNGMIIPVLREKKEKMTTDGIIRKSVSQSEIKPLEFEGLPAFEFFKNIDDTLYSYTTLEEVNSMLVEGYTVRTLETCKHIASNYKTRKEWQIKDNKSYTYAIRRGWIEECCVHMDKVYDTHTLESCMEEASKYKTQSEWRKNHMKSFSAAYQRGWVKECTKHMVNPQKSHTLESCMKSALKYKTKTEWYNNDPCSRNQAIRRGWYDECTAHMVKKIK